MRAYRYRATDIAGRVEQGTLQAANENALRLTLADRHLELIEYRAQMPQLFTSHRAMLSAQEIAAWTRQMGCLLKAGVRLLDALRDTAADQALTPRMRSTINNIAAQVEQGKALSVACAMRPPMFDAIFCAILYAAEQGNDLASGFERLADLYTRQAGLQTQIRKALRYPIFLGILASGVVTFMMLGVVPALVTFLQSLNQDLPWATRLLIAFSNHFVWLAGAGLCVVMGGAVVLKLLRHASRRVLLSTDWLWLQMPCSGELARNRQRSLFFQSLSGLVQSRMRLIEALQNALPTLTNIACNRDVERVIAHVESGQALSAALSDWLDPAPCRMLAVGETGHDLGIAVGNVADYYTTRAQEDVEVLLKFIEPALTLCVGALLAWIVLAVLGPIYGSLGNLQAGY